MSHLVRFIEVADPSFAEFDKAMRIYECSFPENERRPISSIRSMLINRKIRLHVGEIDGNIVFMALLYPIHNTPFLIGDYLATAEGCRSTGIGKAFLKYIIDEIRDTQFKYFIVELENPYLHENEIKSRRLKFYRSIGLRELKGVRHILPPFQGFEPTELILMALSLENEVQILGEIVSDLMIRIFNELYDRDEDDELLNLVLKSIPKIVYLD